MGDQGSRNGTAERPAPIRVDASKWGGVDLPDIGEELDDLLPKERAEAARGYRVLALALVGLIIGVVLLAVFSDVTLRGMGKALLLPLILLLSCGVIAAFGRFR